MFKFFRKYNKIILAIGGSLLMVAFLLTGTLRNCSGPAIPPIGTINGKKVTTLDKQSANRQIWVLESQLPILGRMIPTLIQTESENRDESKELLWFLIQEDAKTLGLSASKAEAIYVLRSIGVEEIDVRRIANRIKANEAVVYDAVRSWIVAEQYSEILLGKSHEPLISRITSFNQILKQLIDQGYPPVNAYEFALVSSQDPYRISKPLISHFLQNQNAKVSGKAVVVSSDLYLQDVGDISNADLQTTFNKYKNDYVGESKPYGFGYKIPNRIKLEYLEVPLDECLKAVRSGKLEKYTVQPTDVFSYFAKNKDALLTRFADKYKEAGIDLDAEATKKMPNEALIRPIYSNIYNDLITLRALALGDQIAETAEADLNRALSKTPKIPGTNYYQIKENEQQLPLRSIKEELERDYGVNIKLYNYRDSWTNVTESYMLPGIGQSVLYELQSGGFNPPRPLQISFNQYVDSARELEPDMEKNRLVARSLQTNVPGNTLISPTGFYVFRLTDAQPTHAPESLDIVKAAVERDTRKEKAYNILLNERASWLEVAQNQGLAMVAQQAKSREISIAPTPRVQYVPGAAENTAPYITGIGSSKPLIEALFKVAKDSDESGDLRQSVAEAKRTGEAEVDQTLSLVLFRVDDFLLMTPSEYKVNASNYLSNAKRMNYLLFGSDNLGLITFEMVKNRVNFIPTETTEPEEEPTTPPAIPAPATPEAETQAPQQS